MYLGKLAVGCRNRFLQRIDFFLILFLLGKRQYGVQFILLLLPLRFQCFLLLIQFFPGRGKLLQLLLIPTCPGAITQSASVQSMRNAAACLSRRQRSCARII